MDSQHMDHAKTSDNSDGLSASRALARAHCDAGRWQEGLRLLLAALKDYPACAAIYIDLADCYLAAEDGATAAQLYGRALALEPDDDPLRERLRHARGRIPLDGDALGERNPAHPDAIRRLIERLQGGQPSDTEAQVARAAAMLNEIAESDQPAREVERHLTEINGLLPAVIEVNIRQARREGRPDLAHSLEQLLDQIRPVVAADGPKEKEPSRPGCGPNPRVLFVSPASEGQALRQDLPARALAKAGSAVMLRQSFPLDELGQFNAVVVRHPHASPALMEGLAACAAARVRIILDLECDFEQMPVSHPAFVSLGLGTPVSARGYAAALLLARQITVSSTTLAATLRSAGYAARVIHDGWSADNPLWEQPAPRRHTVNIGWIGAPGQVEEVAMIRRALVRVVREYPQVQLVIGADPEVYRLFETLPEGRCLFLPPVPFDDLPYALAQVDILVVPQRNTPFNRTRSDIDVVHAGVRGIPWVASPIPAYLAWTAGGRVATGLDEWHGVLRRLVENTELRQTLGQAGRKKAAEREMSCLASDWMDVARGKPSRWEASRPSAAAVRRMAPAGAAA
jgi:hypothetical protein